MQQEIVLSIMGVIVSIELVCGVLIILWAFLTWAFSPMQTRIVDTVTIHNRPTALSKTVRPEGSKEIIMSPSRARRRAQCGCGRRVRPCMCPCLRVCLCLRTHRG